MRCKSQVGGQVAGYVRTIQRRAEKLPGRVDDAKRMLAHWRARARRRVGDNPIKTIVGAFAIGLVLAKLVRHA